MKQRQYSDVQVRAVDESKLTVDIIASTPSEDSYGTVIDPDSWDLEQFKRNPVITWAHDDRGNTASAGLPIANAIPETVKVVGGKLKMRLRFTPEDVNPFGYRVFRMIKEGFIHGTSVGFDPKASEWRIDKNGKKVEHYTNSKLLEVAVVTIPSNDDALIESRAHKMSKESRVGEFKKMAREIEEAATKLTTYDPVTWKRAFGENFDVTMEPAPPAMMEFDWVARHIKCEVKEIFQNSFTIPPYRFGGFLMGLRHALAGSKLEEVRNLWGSSEAPPEYNVIELNSRQSEDFLINGIAFYKNADVGNFAYRIYPTWQGLHIDLYSHREIKDFNRSIVDEAWRFAKEENPLKGEAFSLSGDFIRTTDESWDDCFLDDINKKPLKRIVEKLNTKGKATPNRGVVMLGPPGTGKTLSGRIIRNNLKNTSFIWVSTRDFFYGGGFMQAFELAREIAPSVLFLEDIDAWISGRTVDLLKTEMDGIARSSGVVTILTTNFPEQLPAALLDRPGRFHDVLNFHLPTDDTRRAMMKKWVEGLDTKTLDEAVKKTNGYSGAHMYELCAFARNLQESDELAVGEAFTQALKKVEEQKELINQIQLSGSNYIPHRFLMSKSARALRDGAPEVTPETPATVVVPEAPAEVGEIATVSEETTVAEVAAEVEKTEDTPVVETEEVAANPDGTVPETPAAPVQLSNSDIITDMDMPENYEQYVQKCITYFERKQPANKAATRVLKKFFTLRGVEAPKDESEAWQKMGTLLEEMSSLISKMAGDEDEEEDGSEEEEVKKDEKGNVMNDPSGKNNVENERADDAPCTCDKPDCEECKKKKEEKNPSNVEDENAHNNVQDARSPMPSTPKPAEAQQRVQKASVQLPLPVLLALSRGIKNTFKEAGAEALRQGKSKDSLDGIFASMEDSLREKISSHFSS